MEITPDQFVAEFLDVYDASRVYSRERIARLAELATAEDASTAELATRALFTGLVEKFADSFEADAVSLYNRVLAQVIQTCRQDPRAAELDRELKEYGIRNEQDLLVRAENLRQVLPLAGRSNAPFNIERVIILSRVTLGADVAVTSVLIERLKREFPGTEIVLMGGSKMPELFGGDPRVSFKQIGYHRAGTTIERLLTWIDLRRGVSDLTSGLVNGEYLVVDPDSRLTQLGLLPVGAAGLRRHSRASSDQDHATQHRDYLFFPSREFGHGTSLSLSELTSLWLDAVLGGNLPTHPRVSLRKNDIEAARNLVNRLKPGSRPIIAINFGVGKNQLKRVGADFEASLLLRLIEEGAAIILDKGAGDDETEAADVLIASVTRVKSGGRRPQVLEVDETGNTMAMTSPHTTPDILVWNGRIGMLAALIGECDLYIGYDSAGGHIAAALGIPCIGVFAGFGSRRFVDRWRPMGEAESELVSADTGSFARGTKDILPDVLKYASKMLTKSFQGEL